MSITAAYSASGDSVSWTTATSAVRLICGPLWAIEYQVGSGSFARLDPGKSTDLEIDMSTTTLKLRRAQFTGNTTTPSPASASFVFYGVPSGLNVDSDPGSSSSVSGAGSSIAFTTTVPFGASMSVMPQQTVSAVLAFTPAESPAVFGSAYVRLIADGTNAPTFTGFSEHGTSAGYVNTSGIINNVLFWFDGTTRWYAVSQAANATPVTVPTLSTATIASGAPTQIALAYSTTLDAASVPDANAFTVSNTGGADTVTAVSISGSTVTLTKSRTTLSTDTVTVSYTPPTTNPVQSAAGIGAAALTSQAVTNGLSVQYPRLTSLNNATESGNGTTGWIYTSTGANGAPFWQHGGRSTLTLAGDGYIAAVVGGFAAAGEPPMVGFQVGSALGIYTATLCTIYGSGGVYDRYPTTNSTLVNGAIATAPTDILKVTRSGTTATGAVSKDGGATWNTIATWTSISGTLYGSVHFNRPTQAAGPITGLGFA